MRFTHSIVHKALHDAERQSLVARNVATRSNPPTSKAARAPEFSVWTPRELAAFLADTDSDYFGMPFRFAAMTGVRRGEVCGLRWGDLDLDAGFATVRHNVVELAGGGVLDDTPKNHRERSVFLDRALVERLRRHPAEQAAHRFQVGSCWHDLGLVFPAPDGDYLRPDALARHFRAAVKSSGLPRIRFHDLRHGHATGLVSAGIDPATVSRRLGHATTQFTLDVYVKSSSERHAEAASAFADLIASSGESPTESLPTVGDDSSRSVISPRS